MAAKYSKNHDRSSNRSIDEKLYSAVKEGDNDETLRLLRQGADPNRVLEFGNSALHIAVKRGHSTLIEDLIKYGADIEKRRIIDGHRPLHLVISTNNNFECLKELLKYKVDLMSTDNKGNTLLQLTVKRKPNKVDFIKKLISLGMDPNTVDIIGDNCLHDIAFCKLIEDKNAEILTEIFIKEGININCQNRTTFATPLHIAAQCGKSFLVDLLIRKGASMDAMDSIGSTAFDYVDISEATAIDVFRVFIKHLVLMIHRGETINQASIQRIKSNIQLKKLHDDFFEDLESLKVEVIESHRVSYYDILCEKNEKVVNYLRNVEIRDKVLGCPNISINYKKEIKQKIEQVLEIVKIREILHNVVHDIINNKLSYYCVEKVLTYAQGK